MGFLDTIFGTSPKTLDAGSIQQKSLQTAEQKKLLQQLISSFGDPGSFQPEQFQGDINVGSGNIEQFSLDALEARSQALAGGTLQGQAEAGLSTALTQGPQDIDKFFTDTVQNPLLEDFQRDILPAISREFGSGDNFFSSERQETDRRAGEDLLDTLGRERSRTAFEARDADLNRILAAAGLTPEVLGGTSQAVGQTLSAAQQANAPENERLQFEFQKFLQGQEQGNTNISQILSSLGLQPLENIAFAPTVSEGSSGNLGGLLKGGASIAAATGLFSDRRLKREIRQIGTLASGLPIYMYRYVWGGPLRIGVMAQEALGYMPKVVIRVGKWLAVDYSRVW